MVKICLGQNTCLDVNDPTTISYADGVVNLKDFTSTRLPWQSLMGDVIPVSLGGGIGYARKMNVPDYAVTTIWFPGTTTAYNVQRLYVRFQDLNNNYYAMYYYNTTTSTKNLEIVKTVAGTTTVLASTAVTYTAPFFVMIEAEGSTLNLYAGYPLDSLTLLLTATDTSITTPGYAVARHLGAGSNGLIGIWFRTDPPSSPVPKPKQYYLVPVTGKGTEDDPYRPKLTPVLSRPKTRVVDQYAYKILSSIQSLSDNDKNLLMKALGIVADEAEDLSQLSYTAVMPVDVSGELFDENAVVGVLRINQEYEDKVFGKATKITAKEAEEIIKKYKKRQRRKGKAKK